MRSLAALRNIWLRFGSDEYHVAGHGSQTRDQMGDEADGLNETLCPCDFKQVCFLVPHFVSFHCLSPGPVPTADCRNDAQAAA